MTTTKRDPIIFYNAETALDFVESMKDSGGTAKMHAGGCEVRTGRPFWRVEYTLPTDAFVLDNGR